MKRHALAALTAILGAERLGALYHHALPRDGFAWGGPMNGQGARCRMVAQIIAAHQPCAIIETGSYRGTTTEWFASFQTPVFSCEANGVNYGFATSRLASHRHVAIQRSDSRAFLRALDWSALNASGRPVLFYLDAHWHEDLPLAEELAIVLENCAQPVVVIDDFEVPDDPAYAFDDYGPGKALTWDYVAAIVSRHGLAAAYPATPSGDETGARRGCLALARNGALLESALLRAVTAQGAGATLRAPEADAV